MEIKKESNIYFFEDENTIPAYLNYEEDEYITINLVYVNPEYRGQKLGKKLVIEMAEDTIKKEKQIIAICPFAKKILETDPEYKKHLINAEN